jgi:hypothetical protein
MRDESESAPGKSGKKMADQVEGMRSFGFRLSGNSETLKISQMNLIKAFSLQPSFLLGLSLAGVAS